MQTFAVNLTESEHATMLVRTTECGTTASAWARAMILQAATNLHQVEKWLVAYRHPSIPETIRQRDPNARRSARLQVIVAPEVVERIAAAAGHHGRHLPFALRAIVAAALREEWPMPPADPVHQVAAKPKFAKDQIDLRCTIPLSIVSDAATRLGVALEADTLAAIIISGLVRSYIGCNVMYKSKADAYMYGLQNQMAAIAVAKYGIVGGEDAPVRLAAPMAHVLVRDKQHLTARLARKLQMADWPLPLIAGLVGAITLYRIARTNEGPAND